MVGRVREKNERRTIDSDVAQRGRAIVLYVRIRAGQQVDQHRDRSRVDELLPIVVCATHALVSFVRPLPLPFRVATHQNASC